MYRDLRPFQPFPKAAMLAALRRSLRLRKVAVRLVAGSWARLQPFPKAAMLAALRRSLRLRKGSGAACCGLIGQG